MTSYCCRCCGELWYGCLTPLRHCCCCVLCSCEGTLPLLLRCFGRWMAPLHDEAETEAAEDGLRTCVVGPADKSTTSAVALPPMHAMGVEEENSHHHSHQRNVSNCVAVVVRKKKTTAAAEADTRAATTTRSTSARGHYDQTRTTHHFHIVDDAAAVNTKTTTWSTRT